MKKLNPSQCRSALKDLTQEEAKIIHVFMERSPLLKGMVYKTRTKCGKKGCRCEREGKLHIAWRISRSHKGRSRSRCLDIKSMLEYKRLTQNYRRFRQARARLVKMHEEKKKLADLLERARRKEDF